MLKQGVASLEGMLPTIEKKMSKSLLKEFHHLSTRRRVIVRLSREL